MPCAQFFSSKTLRTGWWDVSATDYPSSCLKVFSATRWWSVLSFGLSSTLSCRFDASHFCQRPTQMPTTLNKIWDATYRLDFAILVKLGGHSVRVMLKEVTFLSLVKNPTDRVRLAFLLYNLFLPLLLANSVEDLVNVWVCNVERICCLLQRLFDSGHHLRIWWL